MEGARVGQDVVDVVGYQHVRIGDEPTEDVRREQGASARVVGHERTREVQIGSELELQETIAMERQLPVVVLDEPVVETVPVVLEEGARSPFGHHHDVGSCQLFRQRRQRGRDVRVRVVTDQVLDGGQVHDLFDLGHRVRDGQRRSRVEQDAVVTILQEVGVALELVARETTADPPDAVGDLDRTRRIHVVPARLHAV